MRVEKSKFINTEKAVRALRSDGFTHNLKLDDEKLTCLSTGNQYHSSQAQISEMHCFEPQNTTSSIVLAIKCDDGTKGILVHYFRQSIGSKLMSFIKNGEQLSSNQAAA